MLHKNKTMINLSLAVVLSVSITACGGGGGGSSSSGATVPTPTASFETAPTGYVLPSGSASDGTSTIYVNESTTLSTLQLPQGGGTPLAIVGPTIATNSIVNFTVQQFNTSNPILLLNTGSAGSTVVYYSSSSAFSSAQIQSATWESYSFMNVTRSSSPVSVYTNGGVYTGVSSESSFLAYQSSTSATDGVLVPGAGITACSTSGSTSATTIANTVTNSSNAIAIGTNNGELLIYGASGTNQGICSNLTNAAQASVYSKGSAITAVSFTTTSSANYGYFATASGQVWRIVANTSNNPQSFTQIAGSGSSFQSLPSGTVTALFSDRNNNVYIGSSNGTLYTLAPTNSAGSVNTSWTSVSLGSVPVLSISATTNGKIIATTSAGVYNISFNGS